MAQTHSSVRATAALRRLVALALIGGSLPASAQEAPGVSAENVVGCYRLEYAVWPDSLDHLPNPDRLPERLELTPDPFLIGVSYPDGTGRQIPPPGLDGAHAVRYAGIPAGGGPFSYWRLSEGRLFLSRYLPMFGFLLAVDQADGDWEGTLTGSTDIIPEDGNASADVRARLVREPCPQQ